jgi:hypothetical protein
MLSTKIRMSVSFLSSPLLSIYGTAFFPLLCFCLRFALVFAFLVCLFIPNKSD